MNAFPDSAWLVLTLTAGAVSVIFLQSATAFPDTRGPYITRINGPDTLTAGEETAFNCTADCTPPCTYNWTVDGKTVQGQVITLTANGLSSSTDVECTSLNPKSGDASSTSRTLTVKNPVSVKPSAGKEPTLNQPFKVICAGSGQMSTIKWYKGGDDLALDSQMTLSADNSTLSFSSLLPSHGGFYQCVPSKNNKRIISVGYLLTYGSLSVNISGPDTVEVGKEYTFKCLYSCDIDCSIYWTYRGGFPSGSYTQQKTVIKWTPDTPNTTQTFTCVAENTSALKSTNATKLVTVFKKPGKKVIPDPSGSMALKPSTALCLMVFMGFLFLRGV